MSSTITTVYYNYNLSTNINTPDAPNTAYTGDTFNTPDTPCAPIPDTIGTLNTPDASNSANAPDTGDTPSSMPLFFFCQSAESFWLSRSRIIYL